MSELDTLSRVEGKIDSLAAQVMSLAVSGATTAARVDALEKLGARRWSLAGSWIASATAVALAVLDLVVHR